jgi:hypothetical protein
MWKFRSARVQLKCDGTRWRTGGEVKTKLANGVCSQYSYTTSEHGASSITTVDAHTSAASSRLNWHPRRFKWTRPFRRKTKSGFCACAITFQTQSNTKLAMQTVVGIPSSQPSTGFHLLLSIQFLLRLPGEVSLADYLPQFIRPLCFLPASP